MGRPRGNPDVLWRGVVKVQRSIVSTEGGTMVLIYNQDRSVSHTGGWDPTLAGWFGAPGETDEYKFFAYAELRGTVVHLLRKVRWRSW